MRRSAEGPIGDCGYSGPPLPGGEIQDPEREHPVGLSGPDGRPWWWSRH